MVSLEVPKTFISRYELRGTVIQMSVALFSIVIAFLGREVLAPAGGLVYFLLFPLVAVNKKFRNKALKKASPKSS